MAYRSELLIHLLQLFLALFFPAVIFIKRVLLENFMLIDCGHTRARENRLTLSTVALDGIYSYYHL